MMNPDYLKKVPKTVITDVMSDELVRISTDYHKEIETLRTEIKNNINAKLTDGLKDPFLIDGLCNDIISLTDILKSIYPGLYLSHTEAFANNYLKPEKDPVKRRILLVGEITNMYHVIGPRYNLEAALNELLNKPRQINNEDIRKYLTDTLIKVKELKRDKEEQEKVINSLLLLSKGQSTAKGVYDVLTEFNIDTTKIDKAITERYDADIALKNINTTNISENVIKLIKGIVTV